MCQNCLENSELDDKLFMMHIMGLFFGYPKCCIEFFLERAKIIHIIIAHGGNPDKVAELPEIQREYKYGFIPCLECASKISPGEEQKLIINRACKSNYPEDNYTKEEFMEFLDILTRV